MGTQNNEKDLSFSSIQDKEFTLRNNQIINKDGKTWFLDTETAIYNEFEKREKHK